MAGDYDSLLRDYTEASFAILPDGSVVKGLGPLRGFFQQVIPEFTHPSTVFNLNQHVVEGEMAYISWSAETPKNVFELGSDTFHISDGKIRAQTLACKVTPK